MRGATNELIDRLSADLAPVSRHALARRLGMGLLTGALVAVVAMLVGIGPRADFVPALALPSFWIKLVYTALLLLAGFLSLGDVARPAGSARRGAWLALVVLAIVAVMGTVQYLTTSPPARNGVLFGHSANVCPVAILALSVPIFLGAVWALRGLAPTRLTLAGAVAGFCAGAASALIYSFSCGETGIAFLASWYTLGTLASAGLGALFGRLALHW
ncbi:hypothetical protein Sa4125_00950 [Aureimonas sp. SA4125]|uniref:NrsF family protein n=1 Tax=Aureimonas sp. SA4125 TaxID=2826993 RepID=UPI001CC3FC1A|nr:DUF1109 domain-containing protein [Aureimonas sp. SA4125]BDA82553.1 hypothetical protein Sa4125_00950 [Aureimonas sp. SA4125]